MIEFDGLGHINICVDDIDVATKFYSDIFGAKAVQEFPHFKNIGFAKSAGFMEHPENVDVSIRFLEIPNANVFLELFKYHRPTGKEDVTFFDTNDLGGARHICLRVKNIEATFEKIKQHPDTKLISGSADYKPFYIDKITPEQFKFFDDALENNAAEKDKVCHIIGGIRYFYFIDKYGVQWEFEQGHNDIGA